MPKAGCLIQTPTALFSSALLLAGCTRSCGHSKPFVPYSIDAAAPSLLTSDASSSGRPNPSANLPDAEVAAFAPIKAERLAPKTSRLALPSGELQAPSGQTFELVVRGELDETPGIDIVAWMRPSDDALPGVLHIYSNVGEGHVPAPRVLATAPMSLSQSGCTFQPELMQVGRRTVALSLMRSCSSAQPSSPASDLRWIGVVMPTREPALRLDAQLAAPLPSESVELRVDGTDRDGDDIDDVSVTVSLSGNPPMYESAGPATVAATLRYFDRPAGLSREPLEPELSLRAEAQRIGKLAKRKNSLSLVASSTRNLRRLYQVLCAEAGAPRFTLSTGPISCGEGTSLLDADRVEFESATRSSDALALLGAFDRMQRASAVSARSLEDMRKQVEKFAPTMATERVDVPLSVALGSTETPSLGTLAFDDAGRLLVRTTDSVVRYDYQTRTMGSATEATGADPSVEPWPTAVSSPDRAWRLAQVTAPCDGTPVTLHLEFVADPARATVVALPSDAWSNRLCPRGVSSVSAGPRLIAWGTLGLELAVLGTPYLVSPDMRSARVTSGSSMQAFQLGSARSPDGRLIALPTALGVAVVGARDKTRVWKASGEHNPQGFRDCVVANGASAVACVERNHPFVLVPSAQDAGE